MLEELLNESFSFFGGAALVFCGLLGGGMLAVKWEKGKIEGVLYCIFGCSLFMLVGGYIHPFAVQVGQTNQSWIMFPDHKIYMIYGIIVSGSLIGIIYISDKFVNKVR